MSNNRQKKNSSQEGQQAPKNESGGGGGDSRRATNSQVGGQSKSKQEQMEQLKRYFALTNANPSSGGQKKKATGRSTETLIKRIFKSTQKFEEFNKLCQQQKRSICSNMIGKSDLYFQCFDCNKESQDTILCQTCFIKGSHTYHKVVYFNDMDDGGQCDCGDTSQKYPTFCEDHPVKKKETEHEKERMLALISPEITERITNYFEEEFIKIFKALDVAKSGQYFSISQDIFQLLNSMIFLMNNRVPMIYLISDLLTKHLDFQPATYEKHIDDQIITINQSPYPSFLSKNKKISKKKRSSKENQDDNQSQNVHSSTNIQHPSSTMIVEEDLQGSPFNLSNSSPVGLVNSKQKPLENQNNNGGFSIKNSLFRSDAEQIPPSPLSMIPINNQGMNFWNNGGNFNNMQLLTQQFPQQQQQQTLEQQIAALSAAAGIITTPNVSQSYINVSEGLIPFNNDSLSQTPLINSSNFLGITSLNNLGDMTSRSNQMNPSLNTAPTTPYNGGISLAQFPFPSPFFNPMGAMMQTPFAFQQMTSPSPFWTYSPYISQQVPQFASKIDQNFSLASNTLSSSTPQSVHPLEWQFSQTQQMQPNYIQIPNQQQQQFNLPPPMQIISQQQQNDESDKLPCFAQSTTIQESSLFAAPSPIQKVEQSEQIIHQQEIEVVEQSNQIPLAQQDTTATATTEINFFNKENQQKDQEQEEQQKPNQEETKIPSISRQNSNTGGINIFKFLSSSRVSFGIGDSTAIFGSKNNQNEKIEQNESKGDERENRVSFSSSTILSMNMKDKEEKDKDLQQKCDQNIDSLKPQGEQKKLRIFDEGDQIGQFSQFKKQTQKQFVDFPSVPQTPSTNLNQDNNSPSLQNFTIDSSQIQNTPAQQPHKKWIEFPSIKDINNQNQDQQKQIQNTPSSNLNYSITQSDYKESPYQTQLTPISNNTESIQNSYLTKTLLNQLSNQTFSKLNDINNQSKFQIQNESENASKSSQEQNISSNNLTKGNNSNDEQQKSNNMIEEESDDVSRSPSKIGKEDLSLHFTSQQKEHQQQIINQILKRRATLEIDDILGGDSQKKDNGDSQRKKKHIEELKEQEKNTQQQNNQSEASNNKQLIDSFMVQNNMEVEENRIKKQDSSSITQLGQSFKSSATMELEKEKWCLLELLFLYYPKYCNDQTDKSLQRVIMIAFLDWSFRPLLVKFYTTYFDLIIETSKFEFYLWKICFQFFNESLESDFVINNTVMIEKVVKGVEVITKDFRTKNYDQSMSKRKILETMVLAFLQQRNAKYYGRSNRFIIQLYLESMSQSDLLYHINFDHSSEYLRFEAILTRISQLINRNVRSIYYIDQTTFQSIAKSIFTQLNNFVNGQLFREFIASFSVPSIAHLKRKDDGQDAEKIYPFYNNKIRIFFIYFAQYYIESTSPPPTPPTFSQNLIPSAVGTQNQIPIAATTTTRSSLTLPQNIPSTTTRTSITLASATNFNPTNSSNNLNTNSSSISSSSHNLPPENLGDNFDFYNYLKNFIPELFPNHESIDNLLINLAGYLTKVLLFVDLKERNYDLNDPTAHLLAEEEGYDNPNSELTLLQSYKSSKLYDYDFSCLQFIFTLIPNNSLALQTMWQSISSLIKKQEPSSQIQVSLFDLTMDKILVDTVQQQNLEFFLYTLCNLCLNSIPLLNSLSPNQKLQTVSWMKQSVEFAVIMSFFDKPLQDFYQIKENLKERFEINVQYLDLEGCVSKVAEWDENHKKFRLKREFQNMVEPYFAERNRALANDMYQTLKQQMQRDLSSDLVLGNMLEFMETKRCHNEKKNKRNIFSQNQSLLLKNQNFLMLLSRICENLREITAVNMNLAKHTLKLLQIIFIRSSIDRKNHQVHNTSQDKSGNNQQSTNQQQSNQSGQQPTNNVNSLLQEDLMLFRLFISNQKIKEQLTNYSVGKDDDLKRSTKKIINIFNAFQDIYQKENQIILMQIRRRNSSIDEENKKSEIKSQQQRIMEEFRKKQLNFQAKSNTTNQEAANQKNGVGNNQQSNHSSTNDSLSLHTKQGNPQNNSMNPQLNCIHDESDNLQTSDINSVSQQKIAKPKRINPPLPPECLICRTTSTERSAILVIPCYFAHDNLFTYFLKESFCNARLGTIEEQMSIFESKKQVIPTRTKKSNLLKDQGESIEIEREEQKNTSQDNLHLNSHKNQQQLSSNLKKSKFSWGFTGCSHQVHSKCHHDAQQNLSIKKKARSAPDNLLHQNESFCAHCKSLLNIHLINIEYFLNTYDYTNMIERLNTPPSQEQINDNNLNPSTIQKTENTTSKENQLNQSNQQDKLSNAEENQSIRSKSSSISSLFMTCSTTSETGYLTLPEIIQELKMFKEERVAPKNLSDLIRDDIEESSKIELDNLLSQLRQEIQMIAMGENIGTFFIKCSYFMSERFLNKDVISYIQKELPMCKSMILNFAVLLQQNPPTAAVISSIKNRLILKLQGMANLNELILRQIDKNDSIDEIFVEILVDVLFLGFVYHPDQQRTEESRAIYEEKGRLRARDGFEWTFVIVTSLLKIIKMNVVVQVACLLHASTSASFTTNPSQMIGFTNILESIKSNSQFRASLFNMVRPFIQMLVCFLLTVFPFSQSQLELLSKNILLDEDEYLHYETILSKEFMTIDPVKTIQATGGEMFLKSFLQILQNQEKQAKIQQFFIHNPSREFKLVQLPASYADFHKAFFFRKCSLCNYYPQTKGSDLHVCLICGEVLCSYSCSPAAQQQQNYPQKKGSKSPKHLHQISDQQRKATMMAEESQEGNYYEMLFSQPNSIVSEYEPGNLSKHALQHHCGKAAFLNIQRTTYILIDFPKSIQFHAKLYANRIGIPFLTGKPLIDWNKYFIDKKIMDHITQIIQDRQLSQYMRHQLMIKQQENTPVTCSLMTQLP